MPATVKVEEALRTPLTNKLEEIVEDAEEINPPPSIDRLATVKVEEADNELATCNGPATVEEPVTIAPFPTVSIPVVEALVRVVTPVTFKVTVAVILATLERSPDIWTFP